MEQKIVKIDPKEDNIIILQRIYNKIHTLCAINVGIIALCFCIISMQFINGINSFSLNTLQWIYLIILFISCIKEISEYTSFDIFLKTMALLANDIVYIVSYLTYIKFKIKIKLLIFLGCFIFMII